MIEASRRVGPQAAQRPSKAMSSLPWEEGDATQFRHPLTQMSLHCWATGYSSFGHTCSAVWQQLVGETARHPRNPVPTRRVTPASL